MGRFHTTTFLTLLVEFPLRPVALSLRNTADVEKTRFMIRFLRIVPRIGIVVLVAGFVLVVKSAV
jgi:hypothetical protein